MQKKIVVEKIPYRPWQILLEVVDIILILTSLFLLFHYWPILPDEIPSHYNFKGEANAWGGKGSLLLLPILGIFMYLLITICERFPKTWNVPKHVTEANKDWVYGNMKNMLCVLKTNILLVFFYIQYCTLNLTSLWKFSLIFIIILVLGPIIFFLIRSYRCKKQ